MKTCMRNCAARCINTIQKDVYKRQEEYRDDGVDLARLKANEMRVLRKDMQMIFQDPYSSLNPRMTVGQIIGEGLLAHGFLSLIHI